MNAVSRSGGCLLRTNRGSFRHEYTNHGNCESDHRNYKASDAGQIANSILLDPRKRASP